MKRSLWMRSIIAALVLTMTVPFFACEKTPDEETTTPVVDTEESENENNETDSDTAAPTETESETESETQSPTETAAPTETETVTETVTETETMTETAAPTETETVTETETEFDPDSAIYGDGDEVKNAGDGWDEEIFAITDREVNEANAVTVRAAELLEKLAAKNVTAEGEVYLVKEPIVLDSNTKYYGNLATVIAEGGIVIKDAEEIVIKELIIKGSITVENSKGITLFRLDMKSGDVGISVDEKCHDVAIKSCRIHATDTAVKIGASLTSFYQNYFCADKGIVSTGDEMAAQSNRIIATSLGISSSGAYCTVKNNSIETAADGVGIDFSKGSYNGLIALNTVKGAQLSIRVNEGFNCSVILNSVVNFAGAKNTNLYVIDNRLGGYINLSDNKYLICDGNVFADDGKPHPVVNTGNTEYNGDTLHDVDARLEVGADEDLLPHTNKDLFLGMERRSKVRDLTQPKSYMLNGYIRNMAKNNDVVIIPPGAYTITSTLNIQAAHSNTTLYAYGVYQEANKYIQNVYIVGASNVNIKGLTIGYAEQSSGQVQVLEKQKNNRLLVISSAGFSKDFGRTDTARFSTGGYFFHPDSFTSWTEIGTWGKYVLVPNEKGEVFNEDGSFTIQLSGSLAGKFFSSMKVGEFFTCRLNETNDRTVSMSNATNILFKDTVTYGYADALCFVIGGRSSGVEFYRHHNLAHSGYEIDKETYDKYIALGEQYNVDLQVYVDEQGRYRGPATRIGSVDATHITGSSEGLSATSTLFENACDDASNQRGNSSALHQVIDNKDGTTTLVFKDFLPETYYNSYKSQGKTSTQPGHRVSDFAQGDRIFVYAANGKVVCDTNVLTASGKIREKVVIYEEDYTLNGQTLHLSWLSDFYAVKVRTSSVNFEALEGYDLENSQPQFSTKVVVDNLSRNSVGFTFDNCMVRHNRGRFVVKTRDAIITNCTFKDTSYAGVVLSVESTWGESSVPCNVTVKNCLFDGTSQTVNTNTNTKYAAIAVEGLGSGTAEVNVSADTLPSKNITIENNVFRNCQNNYYVTVSAVQGINIRNNVFETRDNETSKKVGKAILITGCMDINVSDNTYSSFANGDVTKVVIANNYLNLHGSDVDGAIEKDKLEEEATE